MVPCPWDKHEERLAPHIYAKCSLQEGLAPTEHDNRNANQVHVRLERSAWSVE
jgi:hypothetical protein